MSNMKKVMKRAIYKNCVDIFRSLSTHRRQVLFIDAVFSVLFDLCDPEKIEFDDRQLQIAWSGIKQLLLMQFRSLNLKTDSDSKEVTNVE